MEFDDINELLNKIKNKSEDILVLSDIIQSKLNTLNDLEFEEINKYLEELFKVKDDLTKDINSLKRKTKGI